MIAEARPADKLRSDESKRIFPIEKKAFPVSAGKALPEIHDRVINYCFGVAGVAGLGAGLVAGAAAPAFTG
jgi:hypothetical protein